MNGDNERAAKETSASLRTCLNILVMHFLMIESAEHARADAPATLAWSVTGWPSWVPLGWSRELRKA